MIGIVLGFFLTRATQAQAPQHPELSETKTEENQTQQNAETKPETNSVSKPVQSTKGVSTPVPQNGVYSGRNYSKEEVQQLIRDYSAQYGINPETPLCIARNESGFNQFSKNKSSTASGVFQYLSGTWRSTDEGRIGLNVFDADANVKAAVKYMAIHKNTRPWVVAPKCPKLQFGVPNA